MPHPQGRAEHCTQEQQTVPQMRTHPDMCSQPKTQRLLTALHVRLSIHQVKQSSAGRALGPLSRRIHGGVGSSLCVACAGEQRHEGMHSTDDRGTGGAALAWPRWPAPPLSPMAPPPGGSSAAELSALHPVEPRASSTWGWREDSGHSWKSGSRTREHSTAGHCVPARRPLFLPPRLPEMSPLGPDSPPGGRCQGPL